ncbi:transcriptional repressor [Salipiger abyssi]|uniref:Ferric uptake regulation protein n=1 Tax=Salipiger abyssi TaxID=1250539 RepID=A0A1P8UPU0_9RHOB|nr:transcriptional repressor [Salipiger abyssi]APZ51377.1 Fur family transcriptional regulator, zinc uptake regulator [Salipiger abyssi]
MDTLGFASHDHRHCISQALGAAEETCSAQGLQLTPQRRRVLEILLREHRAMGAYELLDVLRDEGQGAQPPTVYRALDFLVSHGFAHKIERLNAFVACAHPGERHAPAFLICSGCGAVAEMPSRGIAQAVRAAAGELNFEVSRMVIEAEGLCPACREARA